MDFSDAAGTLLLDPRKKAWSGEMLSAFDIPSSLCPRLVESSECVGTLAPWVLRHIFGENSCSDGVAIKVFAGGADNACGALGAGIVREGRMLCSIGTSGVVLAMQGASTCSNGSRRDESDTVAADDNSSSPHLGGKLHFFNHAIKDAHYTMGVTLAAGFSLDWFRKAFVMMSAGGVGESDQTTTDAAFLNLLKDAASVPCGSKGLLFTPYLVGERTPHADASIRGSFVGIDGATHAHRGFFARAVMEGITFSLNESVQMMKQQLSEDRGGIGRRTNGQQQQQEGGNKKEAKEVCIVSIGGGARSPLWLQMQADIFGCPVVTLQSAKRANGVNGGGGGEGGGALGAAMIAAIGLRWFEDAEACAREFVQYIGAKDIDSLSSQCVSGAGVYRPNPANVAVYSGLFPVYQQVYAQTRSISDQLKAFR